jgi:hypothetical protein
MRLLRPSSEAEMIALFLRTELSSDRFGTEIRALLERDGVPENVVTASDLGDDAENQVRLQFLTEQRLWQPHRLFRGLPGRSPLAVDGHHRSRTRGGPVYRLLLLE